MHGFIDEISKTIHGNQSTSQMKQNSNSKRNSNVSWLQNSNVLAPGLVVELEEKWNEDNGFHS